MFYPQRRRGELTRMAPSSVGGFELRALLSDGVVGRLHLATTKAADGTSSCVALRVLAPQLAGDARLFDEVKELVPIRHLKLGQLLEVGRDEASGAGWVATEFVKGRSLADVMAAAAKAEVDWPVALAVRVARDLCLGLSAAEPLVHGEVTPKNVMLTFAGETKLLEFGLAAAKSRAGLHGPGRGTLGHSAPEQIEHRPVDARTDVYAVGVLLHELLAGQPLYTSDAAALLQVLRVVPPSVRQIRREVTEKLADVVAKALQKASAERYQSAEDLLRAIDDAYPSIASDEQLGAFVTKLFPALPAATEALLAAALAPEPSDLSALVRAAGAEVKLRPPPAPVREALPPPPAASRVARWAPAGAGVLVLLGALGWFFTRGGQSQAVEPQPVGGAPTPGVHRPTRVDAGVAGIDTLAAPTGDPSVNGEPDPTTAAEFVERLEASTRGGECARWFREAQRVLGAAHVKGLGAPYRDCAQRAMTAELDEALEGADAARRAKAAKAQALFTTAVTRYCGRWVDYLPCCADCTSLEQAECEADFAFGRAALVRFEAGAVMPEESARNPLLITAFSDFANEWCQCRGDGSRHCLMMGLAVLEARQHDEGKELRCRQKK